MTPAPLTPPEHAAPAKPAPYPADTKAKGWRFGLDMEALQRTDGWALCPDGLAHGQMIYMLLVAWNQTPCGSLPNDDALIAAFIQTRPSAFARNRRPLLRDWWLADDGRLYHPILTEQVVEMLESRARGWRKHREVVMEREGRSCKYCGSPGPLTLDHVIPRSQGGSDEPQNLVPACRSCNSSKGGRTPEQWRTA